VILLFTSNLFKNNKKNSKWVLFYLYYLTLNTIFNFNMIVTCYNNNRWEYALWNTRFLKLPYYWKKIK
jgi:hypothetical protein